MTADNLKSVVCYMSKNTPAVCNCPKTVCRMMAGRIPGH